MPTTRTYRLSEPVDSLSPTELVFRAEGDEPLVGRVLWLSPAANFCTTLTYLGEDGRVRSTLVAYRWIEELLPKSPTA